MEHRKARILNKLTSDRLYSMWADAEFLGYHRCQKTGILRGTCVYWNVSLDSADVAIFSHLQPVQELCPL